MKTSPPNPASALVYVREALDALTTEGEQSRSGRPGTWEPMPRIECSIAKHLDAINRMMGPPGKRPFTGLVDAINQAVVALAAAEQCLIGEQL